MNRLLPIVLVVLLPNWSAADEHEKALQAFGDTFVGTWVNESPLERDVPGLGKKGDTIRIEGTIEPSNGVYLITWTTLANGKTAPAGVAVAGWGASRKAVTAHFFDALGTATTVTYRKSDGKWLTEGHTVEPDGTLMTDSAVLTVTKDTHTYQITNRKRGDEKLPDETAVWKRK